MGTGDEVGLTNTVGDTALETRRQGVVYMLLVSSYYSNKA